jgi:hypothetical protein
MRWCFWGIGFLGLEQRKNTLKKARSPLSILTCRLHGRYQARNTWALVMQIQSFNLFTKQIQKPL